MNAETAVPPGVLSELAETRSMELEQAWRQFGTAESPEDFCRSWLALQCHRITGVIDAVVVLQKPGAEIFAPVAFWPESGRDLSHLAELTQRALREGRGLLQQKEGSSESADLPDHQVAYPVRVDGRMRAVVAMDIGWRDEAMLQDAMRQLQWGGAWLEVLLRRHADASESARQRLKLVLDLASHVLERPSLKDGATAMLTDLAAQLGCDRALLGLLRGDDLKIEAISHTVQFDPRANVLNAVGAAMLEAIDQAELIVYPQDATGRLVVTFAHAELAQLSGAGGIVTLPLMNQGRPVGALMLERGPGYRFDPPAVELAEGLAAMLGPLLHLQTAGQRTLPAHTADSARGAWQRLVGPGHGMYKFVALGTVLLVAFLAMADGRYRVSATARVEGQVQRSLTAPFQGYVREALHRAGDTVSKGQLLARLDDRDLKVERVRLASQKEQLDRQYRESMSRADRSQVRVLGAQIEQAQAQLSLVEEQLARTEVVAPFDGVLVSGDLAQSLGAPVERGQVLFEVAPLDEYRVVLQVDERHIPDVKVGQKGELVLSALPGSRFPFAVTRITPVTAAMDGRNVFRVEGAVEPEQLARLRPGMEGVGKVHVEERRLLWIWTHELVTWVKLKLWAWMP